MVSVHGGTYEVANKHDVEELKRADDDQEQHEGIKQLGALRCLLYIAAPYSLHDVLRVVGGLGFDGGVGCAGHGWGDCCALLGRHCGGSETRGGAAGDNETECAVWC